MSVDAVSGLSGSDYALLNRSSTVAPARAVTLAPAVTPTAGDPTKVPSPTKPQQPFLLVPTVPLSPTVLAELIGLQFSLNGPAASE